MPAEPAVEALRSLRNSVALHERDGEFGTSVLITAATTEAGKSFVAANLAVLTAAAGRRVLLVDLDLRAPRLHTYFGIDRDRSGLVDVVAERCTLEEAVVHDVLPGLDVLLPGRVLGSPGDLLMQPRFEALMKDLQRQYGQVIIDSAPILPVGDTLAIGRMLFTGTEYIRTWDYYRNEYDSVWAFSFERLITYYATASNNGIGLLVENNQWPLYSGRFIAEWLYLMPEIGDWMRESLGDPMSYYLTFLDRFARPEFNSATGLFQVVFDLGYAGSMLYFLAIGAFVGRLWDLWRHQSPFGVLFYPVAMMFLVELLRFNYFAATRFFPLAMALLLVWIAARQVPLQPHPRTVPW